MDVVLQIIISAVDQASEALAGIGEAMSGLTEDATEATTGVSAAFDGMTATVGASTDAQAASFALLNEVLKTDSVEIQQAILATGQTFDQVTAQIAADNAAQEASDEEAAATVETTSGAMRSNFTQLGVVAGIAFTAVMRGINSSVSSAELWDETSASIAQTLKDTGSSIPLSQIQAYAEQIQATTLYSQQAALSSEAVILNNKNLQGSYQQVTSLSADLAQKMAEISGTMTGDLPNATKILTNALEDPVAGLNQLIRQGGVDFPAATVTMIENLAKAGDTAGADSVILETLQGRIGGLATAASQAQGGGLVQLGNQLGAMGTAIGNDLLKTLDPLVEKLMPVVEQITAWAAEHPKLVSAIVLGAAALLGLLVAISAIGILLLTLPAAFAAVGAAVMLLGAPILPVVLLIGFAVGLIIAHWQQVLTGLEAVGPLIAIYWNDLWTGIANFVEGIVTKVENTWDGMLTFGSNVINQMKDMISTVLQAIGTIWNTAWQDDYNFFFNIWTMIVNGLKSQVNDVISIIDGLISAIDSLHISIPAIQIPGTKIGTPALDIQFDIPQIPHLAAGGIATVPTVALIGEAGPEAVIPLSSSGFGGAGGGAGGGPSITININGGMFLNPSSVKQLTDQIAKTITQNLRVKNYAL
jgi:hypothetical protein